MNRSALITVFACLVAFVLGFVLGRFSYVDSTMNAVGDRLQQASESVGIPSNSTSQSAQGTEASQQEAVNVNTSSLTPGQRQLIEALGIDADSITITAEMVACAEAKLGAARVEEIKGGATPSFSEGVSLAACYTQ